MTHIIRKIGVYEGDFSYENHSLVLNLTSETIILFGRITDSNMPAALKQIAQNVAELYEFIKDITDDKISVNKRHELVLSITLGRKVKEYIVALEKAEISSQQKDKKRIAELQKILEQKQFQLNFYKTEYHLLLKNLQLKPNLEELSKLYMQDVSKLSELNQSKTLNQSSSSLFSMQKKQSDKLNISSVSQKVQKVGKSQYNNSFLCPNKHSLGYKPTKHSFYTCNICRLSIKDGDNRYQCVDCDFDACLNCCAEAPPQNRKYCPKFHALKFASANNYLNRYCDLCKQTLMKQKGYTCIECSYDLCISCFK